MCRLNPPHNINAIGFNPLDNYIYGLDMDTGALVQIGSDCALSQLANVPGLPGLFTSGAFDLDGFFYLYLSADPRFYTVDLRPGSSTYLRLVDPANGFAEQTSNYGTPMSPPRYIDDWVINPTDGYLYAIQSTGYFVRISPATGVSTQLATSPINPGVYGAMAIDGDGFMYVIDNGNGNVYRYWIEGDTATGEFFVSSVTFTGSADATMCPLARLADLDFGDAPDQGVGNGQGNYNTLLANNGPRHIIVDNLFFGTGVTAEDDAHQDPYDLAIGDVDDAVSSMPPLKENAETYSVTLSVRNSTGHPANIYGWVDFNSDGLFQVIESAMAVAPSQATQQYITLTFNVPVGVDLEPGTMTFARFRITTDNLVIDGNPLQDSRSVGPASDGEVEDWAVWITEVPMDFGDAPDRGLGNGQGNYNTLLINNGPRHIIDDNIFFGTGVTAERDALQNYDATGDFDDAVLSMPLLKENARTYTVILRVLNRTGYPANVFGWVDFNSNGLFEEDEASVAVVPSQPGQQFVTLIFDVPYGVVLEPDTMTFARFRITTDELVDDGSDPYQDLRSVGPASDGEVEDWAVFIVERTPAVVCCIGHCSQFCGG